MIKLVYRKRVLGSGWTLTIMDGRVPRFTYVARDLAEAIWVGRECTRMLVRDATYVELEPAA